MKSLNMDDDMGNIDGEKDDVYVNPKDKDRHLRNAYRVLLTRARQGMVIFVPKRVPDDSDQTNLSCKNYDTTYTYLHDMVGIMDLCEKQEVMGT